MISVEQKPQWVPVKEMVSDGTIGAALIDKILDLGIRLRPQTTLEQPLKTLWIYHLSESLDVLESRGFKTVADILKLPAKELATFTFAPILRNRLDNYLTGLLIPPQSRLLQAVFERLQSPAPVEREQEIVEGVEDVLNEVGNKRTVSVLTLRFGLHDGISRTLKETGKLLENPVKNRERVRQIEVKGQSMLRHPPYFERARAYLILPQASFGRLTFGAVLVKDLPELDERTSIEELTNKRLILARYSPTSCIEDLVMEDLSQAPELSDRTKFKITLALRRRVVEIADRRRREAELQAQIEAERLVRRGEPKNNLIPEINLTPQQLESLDSVSIEDLKLSVRFFNNLRRNGIETIGELLRKNRQELGKISQFGNKSAEEVCRNVIAFLQL